MQGTTEVRIKSSYYLAKEILAKDPVPIWWEHGPRKWCKYAIGRAKIGRILKRKAKEEDNKRKKETDLPICRRYTNWQLNTRMP